MSTELNRFSRFATKNPEIVSKCLEKNFDVDALIHCSKEHGFDIHEGDVGEFLRGLHPNRNDIRFRIREANGTMRVLTAEELESVGAGFSTTLAAIANFGLAVNAVVAVVDLVAVTLGIVVSVFE